jgi:hypothetical protein
MHPLKICVDLRCFSFLVIMDFSTLPTHSYEILLQIVKDGRGYNDQSQSIACNIILNYSTTEGTNQAIAQSSESCRNKYLGNCPSCSVMLFSHAQHSLVEGTARMAQGHAVLAFFQAGVQHAPEVIVQIQQAG